MKKVELDPRVVIASRLYKARYASRGGLAAVAARMLLDGARRDAKAPLVPKTTGGPRTGITREGALAALAKHGTAAKAAEALGCHSQTIARLTAGACRRRAYRHYKARKPRGAA